MAIFPELGAALVRLQRSAKGASIEALRVVLLVEEHVLAERAPVW